MADRAEATAHTREPAYLSSGRGNPASLTTVGKMSMLLVGSSISSPAGITPGQRRRPGTRMPPSQLFPFPPKTQNERQEGDGVRVSSAHRGLASTNSSKLIVGRPVGKNQLLSLHGFDDKFTSKTE